MTNDTARCTNEKCEKKETCERFKQFLKDKEPVWVNAFDEKECKFHIKSNHS